MIPIGAHNAPGTDGHFRKVPEGYIAFVEEVLRANTQGATLGETRAKLQEAVELVIDASRTRAREDVRAGRQSLASESSGVKRRDLMLDLPDQECWVLREGGNHSIWCNSLRLASAMGP
jgi:hypothetical protein